MPAMMKKLHRMTPLAVAVAAAFVAGCGPIGLPDLPEPIETPTTTVEAVRLVDSSDIASTYEIQVALENPNEESLPMPEARYELHVGEGRYETHFPPNAELPSEGRITVRLPAVIADGGAANGQYGVRGVVILRPAGQVRQFFYGLGVPLPRAPFSGTGTVQVVGGDRSADAASADADGGAESAADSEAAGDGGGS